MAIDLQQLQTPAPAAPTAGAARRARPLQNLFGAPRVTLQQRMVFTERLSLLLRTGVSLLEALKVMQQQTEESVQAGIIGALAETISAGKSFSAALTGHPQMFPRTYVSLVAAAEEGGFLPQVLDQLLALDDKSSQMRNSIAAAMSYPAFLIVFSIAVVVFVLAVIFPKFEELFASIHDQLPITTVFLMALSAFMRRYWILILVGVAIAGWALAWWLNSEAGRRALDRLKMHAPLLRDIYVKLYLNQTLGVLGLSLSNGVPITVALKAAQEVVSNSVFARLLDDVRNRVNEGSGIAVGFSDASFVPPMVKQMVTTGEQTGKLGMVMVRIAEFYERELSKRLTVLSKAIEPVMLIIMGVVVGLIVASLILPIFKLSSAIH